jgi:uncharacterized cupredoxin-like copper-binding protein
MLRRDTTSNETKQDTLQMNLITKTGFAAAIALSLTTISFAATAPAIVRVSLVGEADQPMSVKVDTAKVKAGPVELVVTNDAIGTEHEVVLVKVKKGEQIAVDGKKHRVNEDQLKSMGEVAGLQPGDHGKLKVQLVAGDYVLMCNQKGHYEMGMYTPFTVTN